MESSHGEQLGNLIMRRGLAILLVALSPECHLTSCMPIVDQFARFANLRKYDSK